MSALFHLFYHSMITHQDDWSAVVKQQKEHIVPICLTSFPLLWYDYWEFLKFYMNDENFSNVLICSFRLKKKGSVMKTGFVEYFCANGCTRCTDICAMTLQFQCNIITTRLTYDIGIVQVVNAHYFSIKRGSFLWLLAFGMEGEGAIAVQEGWACVLLASTPRPSVARLVGLSSARCACCCCYFLFAYRFSEMRAPAHWLSNHLCFRS